MKKIKPSEEYVKYFSRVTKNYNDFYEYLRKNSYGIDPKNFIQKESYEKLCSRTPIASNTKCIINKMIRNGNREAKYYFAKTGQSEKEEIKLIEK